jgi:hypothetical protein
MDQSTQQSPSSTNLGDIANLTTCFPSLSEQYQPIEKIGEGQTPLRVSTYVMLTYSHSQQVPSVQSLKQLTSFTFHTITANGAKITRTRRLPRSLITPPKSGSELHKSSMSPSNVSMSQAVPKELQTKSKFCQSSGKLR